jgi:Xaa-Pro aminopeptidase
LRNRKGVLVGYKMHVTAMKMAKPALWSAKIAGEIEGIALTLSDIWTSFQQFSPSMARTLHNHDHYLPLRKDDYYWLMPEPRG